MTLVGNITCLRIGESNEAILKIFRKGSLPDNIKAFTSTKISVNSSFRF